MKDFFLNFAIDVIIGLKNLFLLSSVPVSENSETTERDYCLAPGAASAQSLVSRHGGKIPALAASLHHTTTPHTSHYSWGLRGQSFSRGVKLTVSEDDPI